MGSYEVTMAGRLLLAALLGGAVGLERESQGRPAGLRTHMLVALGACLIMLVGVDGFPLAGRDPFRLAAQVVSGIGFLGAGTILRDGSNVKGLTTAASLWVVAGVGIAAGVGFYSGAVACTLLVVLSLVLLSRVEARLPYHEYLSVRMLAGSLDVSGVLKAIGDAGVKVGTVSLSQASGQAGDYTLTVRTESGGPQEKADALTRLLCQVGVSQAVFSGRPGEWESLPSGRPHSD